MLEKFYLRLKLYTCNRSKNSVNRYKNSLIIQQVIVYKQDPYTSSEDTLIRDSEGRDEVTHLHQVVRFSPWKKSHLRDTTMKNGRDAPGDSRPEILREIRAPHAMLYPRQPAPTNRYLVHRPIRLRGQPRTASRDLAYLTRLLQTAPIQINLRLATNSDTSCSLLLLARCAVRRSLLSPSRGLTLHFLESTI